MRPDSIDWENAAFWVVLVAITQGVIWLLPFPNVVKMDLTWVLLFLNGLSIWIFNQKTVQFKSYQGMIMSFLFGIGLVALTAESNSDLHSAFSSLLRFNVEESAEKFQHLHGNPINFLMMVGLVMAYGGIVGVVRLAFMRSVNRFRGETS